MIISAVAVLVLAGCTDDADELADLPEARLVYPGSVQLADGSRGEESTITGRQGAEWWIVFGADAEMDEVVAFFDGELVGRGWVADSVASTTNELDAYAWVMDEYRFRLGYLDMDDLVVDGGGGFETVFDMRLQKPPAD